MNNVDARPTPWWRRCAAYGCLFGIAALALWFTKLADNAEPAVIAAATPGYSVTLIVAAGCLIALLVGVYDVPRLRYLVQSHESTVSAVSKTDADMKIITDGGR